MSDISIPFKFGVIQWPLFLYKHLRTVLVEALLRDTWYVRRAPCVWQQSVALYNELQKQKLINNFNYYYYYYYY